MAFQILLMVVEIASRAVDTAFLINSQAAMEMYDAYHALGGNGMITKMMHEIEELHLKKKEV